MKHWKYACKNFLAGVWSLRHPLWPRLRKIGVAVIVLALAGIIGLSIRYGVEEVGQSWYRYGHNVGQVEGYALGFESAADTVGRRRYTEGWLEGFRYGEEYYLAEGIGIGWAAGYRDGVFANQDPFHYAALQLESKHLWADVLAFSREESSQPGQPPYIHMLILLPEYPVPEEDMTAFGVDFLAALKELRTDEETLIVAFAARDIHDPEGMLWVTQALGYNLDILFLSSFTEPEKNSVESYLSWPIPAGTIWIWWPSNPYAEIVAD